MCRPNYSFKTGPVSQNNFMPSNLIQMVSHWSYYNNNDQIYNYLLLFAYPIESIMHWCSYI